MEKNLSSLQEAQLVNGEMANSPELLANAEGLFLSDGSSSGTNARAVEILLSAVVANRLTMPVMTMVYPGESIEYVLQGTPYRLGIEIPDQFSGQYEQSQELDERTFTLDHALVAKHYEPLMGDPFKRIESILNRGIAKRSASADVQAKVLNYISQLPANLFSTGITKTPYLDVLIHDRLSMTAEVSGMLYGTTKNVELSEPSELLHGHTLRGLLQIGSNYLDISTIGHIAKMKCPECSLSSDRGPIEHVIDKDGIVYRTYGSYLNKALAKVPQCDPVKKIIAGDASILDISLSTLINAGFRLSGKVIFLAMSGLYKPNTVQAVRDYSEANGTIELASNLCKETVITPRVYVNVTDQGKERSASAYEMLGFMRSSGVGLVTEFANLLPVLSDQRTFNLNITEHTIDIILTQSEDPTDTRLSPD